MFLETSLSAYFVLVYFYYLCRGFAHTKYR